MIDINSISLFSGLKAELIDILNNACVTRHFPKNSIVINEGDASNSLYLLVEGSVKVFVSDEQGRDFILNQLSPGDYFGEFALLDDETRSASVMTLEKSTFKIITQEAFSSIKNDYQEISEALIKNLVSRVRQLTDNVKTLALKDVYGRLRKLLNNLAVDHGSEQIIERATQQDLANRIGSSREMVARIIKDLCIGGYVKVEKKQISIIKPLPENY